jgi:LmbE family N-acetylglucosaminyl deacetylase
MDKIALALCAHPDDAEFMCTGTMALLHRQGWKTHIATMTPGDVGSVTLSREEISQVRRSEGAKAAGVLNGIYHCLESRDVFVMYNEPTLLKAIKLIREVRPQIVFAPSPDDYMIDHEVASKLAQTACLAAGIPNIEITGTERNKAVPHLYYVDPIGGTDKLGRKINSDILVDISSVIGVKEEMLCCHASQRNWLFEISKVDEYVIMMKKFSGEKGSLIGTEYAEGFRQHLGFSYPQSNILKSELGDWVHV